MTKNNNFNGRTLQKKVKYRTKIIMQYGWTYITFADFKYLKKIDI